ncbi:MAG: pitrilysin family protein [Cyanobacteria bacterium P01_D01_bin.123]
MESGIGIEFTLVTSPLTAPVRQLNNGMSAIVHPIPVGSAVAVDVWIKTGGRHEPPALLGVSHFLEHMVFKGSDRVGPGMLDSAVERRGGLTNAATSQDYTHFYITVAADDLADTLPYLAEVVTRAAIPADEFERERQVVIEEILRSEDDPDRRAFKLMLNAAYQNHPYRRPVLGTIDSLNTLTPEMMRAYHRSWYQPEHMTVVVVGQVEPDATFALLEQHFGTLTSSHREVDLPVFSPEPPLDEVRRVEQAQPRLEQTRLMLAWPGASSANWEDACGLECLASVLGDGRSSRLVQLLREELGLVRGIGSASAVHLDPGLFTISAYLEAADVAAVESAILAEVDRLRRECISPVELQRVRRILANEFVFAAESPMQLAHLYGYYQLNGGTELARSYLRRVHAISAEELRDLARTYLLSGRYFCTVLKPEECSVSVGVDSTSTST